MKTIRHFSYFQILLLLFSAWCDANAFELKCPETLSVTQHIDAPPTGWTSWFRNAWAETGTPDQADVIAKIPVSHLELYINDPGPSNTDDLPPDGGYGEGAGASKNYRWSGLENQKKVIAACTYGSSDIRLLYPLPSGISRCLSRFNRHIGRDLILHCEEKSR